MFHHNCHVMLSGLLLSAPYDETPSHNYYLVEREHMTVVRDKLTFSCWTIIHDLVDINVGECMWSCAALGCDTWNDDMRVCVYYVCSCTCNVCHLLNFAPLLKVRDRQRFAFLKFWNFPQLLPTYLREFEACQRKGLLPHPQNLTQQNWREPWHYAIVQCTEQNRVKMWRGRLSSWVR